jgi:hypothetical protein
MFSSETDNENKLPVGSVPLITPQNMMEYSMFMKGYLRRFGKAHLALTENKPTREEIASNGNGSVSSTNRGIQSAYDELLKSWEKRNDIAVSVLLDSCKKCPSAMLVIKAIDSDIAKVIWDALMAKFNNMGTAIKQMVITKFNNMRIEEEESLKEFMERMVGYQLDLIGLGVIISQDVDMVARFKAAVLAEKRFESIGHIVSYQTHMHGTDWLG